MDNIFEGQKSLFDVEFSEYYTGDTKNRVKQTSLWIINVTLVSYTNNDMFKSKSRNNTMYQILGCWQNESHETNGRFMFPGTELLAWKFRKRVFSLLHSTSSHRLIALWWEMSSHYQQKYRYVPWIDRDCSTMKSIWTQNEKSFFSIFLNYPILWFNYIFFLRISKIWCTHNRWEFQKKIKRA